LLKMMFAPTPSWIKKVEKTGKPAQATVLSGLNDIFKGISGNQGRDGRLDIEVEVQPIDETPFKVKMQWCLGTALGEMVEPGLYVNGRYHPMISREFSS